jgi:hypothetical protein
VVLWKGEEMVSDMWGWKDSQCLGIAAVGWVALGKTGKAMLCLVSNHLHCLSSGGVLIS